MVILMAKSVFFVTQERANPAPAKLGTLVAKPEEPNGKKVVRIRGPTGFSTGDSREWRAL